MPIDIELPRWSASVACEIAGLGLDGPSVIRKWRRDGGLRLGKFVADEGWLFTVLDIGELTITYALHEVGVSVSEAITRARAERSNLCATLRARLECGYWLPPRLMHVNMSEPTATLRSLSLGEISERVIDKLQLPLPIISKMPREREQAEVIVKAASHYLVSDEFQIRADKFRDEVIARGKPTNWCEASTRLGVPLWLIIDATHSQAIDGCNKSALGSIMSVVRERLAIKPQ